jgi:hypothetical protein
VDRKFAVNDEKRDLQKKYVSLPAGASDAPHLTPDT